MLHDELPTVTADDVIAWLPKPLHGEVKAFLRSRLEWDAPSILCTGKLSPKHRLLVVLRPEMIPQKILDRLAVIFLDRIKSLTSLDAARIADVAVDAVTSYAYRNHSPEDLRGTETIIRSAATGEVCYQLQRVIEELDRFVAGKRARIQP